ncbi:hypothetical protein MKS88_004020 [Plasmodium brasilianum]|uniref:Uncharacterized protein n=1 Tax=Plasmodium brasilianum TaxID=5824 RepID=A0ACB9Y5D4_PLABR|nr:hypothetical protein MKS88_004020 [Plasmodium brasilianum]
MTSSIKKGKQYKKIFDINLMVECSKSMKENNGIIYPSKGPLSELIKGIFKVNNPDNSNDPFCKKCFNEKSNMGIIYNNINSENKTIFIPRFLRINFSYSL